MNKTCSRLLFALLISISIYSCKPAAPILPTSAPTLTATVKPAASIPEASTPAQSPSAVPSQTFTPTPQPITNRLQVLYPKNDNLWVWFAGVTSQVTKNGSIGGFELSGDGNKVAYSRLAGYYPRELWVINVDGSDERLLVSSGDLDALGKSSDTEEVRKSGSTVVINPYAWVPGTYTIAFGTYRSVKDDGTIYHYDLNLVDTETGRIKTLLSPGRGGKFIYSPDGSKIALFTQQQISIVDADGNNRHDKLLEFRTPTFGEAHFFPEIVWSADGKYLLVGLPPEDPMQNPDLPSTLWQIPADGYPAIHLGDTRYPVLPLSYNVTFSPDLKQLAYTTEVDTPSGLRSEVHIANYDGTADRVVQTGGMLYFWNWSPDGQHFIYYSHPNPDAWYISDLEGNATIMDFVPVDVQLDWVNNDTFLYYVQGADQDSAHELRLTSLDGETVMIDWSNSTVFQFGFR